MVILMVCGTVVLACGDIDGITFQLSPPQDAQHPEAHCATVHFLRLRAIGYDLHLHSSDRSFRTVELNKCLVKLEPNYPCLSLLSKL